LCVIFYIAYIKQWPYSSSETYSYKGRIVTALLSLTFFLLQLPKQKSKAGAD